MMGFGSKNTEMVKYVLMLFNMI